VGVHLCVTRGIGLTSFFFVPQTTETTETYDFYFTYPPLAPARKRLDTGVDIPTPVGYAVLMCGEAALEVDDLLRMSTAGGSLYNIPFLIFEPAGNESSVSASWSQRRSHEGSRHRIVIPEPRSLRGLWSGPPMYTVATWLPKWTEADHSYLTVTIRGPHHSPPGVPPVAWFSGITPAAPYSCAVDQPIGADVTDLFGRYVWEHHYWRDLSGHELPSGGQPEREDAQMMKFTPEPEPDGRVDG
jgi:hypothetical protein